MMIRESGAIAEEAVEFSDNVQRRRGLEGGEGGNGGEHGAVKGAGIVEEGAYDLWELLNLGGRNRRGSVSRGELWGRGRRHSAACILVVTLWFSSQTGL